jgi:hypothetical protein
MIRTMEKKSDIVWRETAIHICSNCAVQYRIRRQGFRVPAVCPINAAITVFDDQSIAPSILVICVEGVPPL